MKNLARYTFENEGIIHDIQLKLNQNSKIGQITDLILQTYHFSINQIESGDFTQDAKNCLGCPFSFAANNGKSGGCYTHKGLQAMGLKSKLRSLSKQYGKGKIESFNPTKYGKFLGQLQKFNIDLLRFGAYGEPITLPLQIVSDLAVISKGQFTGYTHAWKSIDAQAYKAYFMASTHNMTDYIEASEIGWRCFTVTSENSDTTENSVLCPASKEAGQKVKCSACQLCKGTASKAKSVSIPIH